jgi:hypothetical protein
VHRAGRIEFDGEGLRRDPLAVRMATLASVLAGAASTSILRGSTRL